MERRRMMNLPKIRKRLSRWKPRVGIIAPFIGGRCHVALEAGTSDDAEHHERTATNRVEKPRSRPHDDGDLLDERRSGIAYLRQTLDAEIKARQRADHLVAGLIDERRT